MTPLCNPSAAEVHHIYMGIRGLGGFLKWKIPTARKNIVWSSYAGQRWAIDCSCLLYRAKGARLSAITVLASLLVRMRAARIVPVVVFDGRTPTAKTETVEARRVVREAAHKEIAEITTGLSDPTLTEAERADREIRAQALQAKAPQVTARDRDDIKKFLYAAGVLFVTAAEEADDVLAYMSRAGMINGVVSTDMDMLARGVPLLIVPETADTTVLSVISLAHVLSELRLTYEQFVHACVLMGTDYTPKGWRTIVPATAVEIARRGVDWGGLDASGGVCIALETNVDQLTGAGVVWERLLADSQREKMAAGAPAREPENLAAFCTAQSWPADWLGILMS
jgi:5'-3' exonuclease